MSVNTPREQHIVISALGKDPIALTNLLCRNCQENRCAIVSSRLTRHGEHSVLTLQINGSWDALARIETTLASLSKTQDIILSYTRSALKLPTQSALPYLVYISALYQPNILAELCQFFSEHSIGLDSIIYDTYQAPQTNTTMLNATITVTLSADTQISWLRDQFLDFADALNLDAMIEPWRPHAF